MADKNSRAASGAEAPFGSGSNRAQSVRILFVCLGNICRSPAAEGVMQHLLNKLQLEEMVAVDSAGTSSYHIGEPADRRMRHAARRRGVELHSRARMAHRQDFEDFDLIVAMDRDNRRELDRLLPGSEKLCLLSDFLDDGFPVDVPDPYFGGDEGFETVLDMLQAACPRLLDRFRLLPAAGRPS